MSPGKWKPGSWMRPSSRRAREQSALDRLGWTRTEHLAKMLKNLWPPSSIGGGPEWDYPAWAKVAHKHGWMTTADYYATPQVKTGRVLPGLYDSFPFFKVIRRAASDRHGGMRLDP